MVLGDGKLTRCSSYHCCITNYPKTLWLKITFILLMTLWFRNTGRAWEWQFSWSCSHLKAQIGYIYKVAPSHGSQLMLSAGWLTYKWSLHIVCTSSQYGSPGSQILTRWLKAPNMSDSTCKMEAPSFFMTWPRMLCRIISITFYWLQVSHKPRFERRDHIHYLLKTGMSRSHCRGACGIGDINGVIFGKYNLLHRVSY